MKCETTTTTIIEESELQACVSCIVCGEPVPLTTKELNTYGPIYKVCDKCKQAILHVRHYMESEESK